MEAVLFKISVLNLVNLLKPRHNKPLDCLEIVTEHVAWLLKSTRDDHGKSMFYYWMIYSEFIPSR